jgi:hypothetical protein
VTSGWLVASTWKSHILEQHTHFFSHTLLTVLYTAVIHISEGTVDLPCLSLSITPLSHMRKCGHGSMHSKLGSMNMMGFFTHFVPVCKEAVWGSGPVRILMSNLQVVSHLPSDTDSERESSLSGPAHNRSLHWLSYPIVTVVHLMTLMRMECNICVVFGLFRVLHLAIYVSCNILKRCWNQQKTCCLPHLPKNTATSAQSIILCHVNGNKIYLLTYSMDQSPSWGANWFCS